jgi:hypothetical protein
MEPPLTVEVSNPIDSPVGNGKVCYVIYVSGGDLAPHFLNGRLGVWVRIDEFSARFDERLANENELRHLRDRIRLIEQRRSDVINRARKRFETYLSQKYTYNTGTRKPLGSRLEVCLIPRFPSRQLCLQEDLAGLVQNSWTDWRQFKFPDQGAEILSRQESAIVLSSTKRLSVFEVNIWGMLFYVTKIQEDHNRTEGIQLFQFVGYLLLFLRDAGELLNALGYSRPVNLEIALDSLLHTSWPIPQEGGWFIQRPGSPLDDEVRFSVTKTSEELRSQPDSVVRELVRYVLFSANWSGLVDSDEKLTNLILAGHRFNRG